MSGYRVVSGGLTRAAQFSGSGIAGDVAGSFHYFAHPATGRCGNASGGIRLVLELLAEKDLLKGKTIRIDATSLETSLADRHRSQAIGKE